MKINRRKFVQAGGALLALSAFHKSFSQSTKGKIMNNEMTIQRNGSAASVEGPEAWFTGKTRIDPVFSPEDPARAGAAYVTFEPGARTAWHTHPLGQRLVVTFGVGLVQCEGGPIEVIRPGDVVWFPPEVKHWHGAAATTGMTHLAVQEYKNGEAVTWLEHVTDEQYAKAPKVG